MNNNQYIFQLHLHDAYNLNDFILSSSNEEAFSILDNWPALWGHLPYANALLLYGPESSGKTYLTKIWQSKSQAYLIGKNEDFKSASLDEHSSFIIEDIEHWDEELLLHYFNSINESGKYLLLTTSKLLNNFSLKDIESRINSIEKVKIEAPDDDLLKIFLFKLFSQASIRSSIQVQNYLLSRLPRQFNEIINFMVEIDAFSLSNKKNLTLPLIKNYLDSKSNGKLQSDFLK
jgi:chromosomal replication initiation ATPase DnaA